jgi:poly-gamma-glutamate synthesis protein (capsule biosynthesis protein)
MDILAMLTEVPRPRPGAGTQQASGGTPASDSTTGGDEAPGSVEFTLNAFGDSGWSDTHPAAPAYNGGFRNAYRQFDPDSRFLGDLNYINWETSVGKVCSRFWAPSTASTYAFLTRPEELADATALGFNLVGLANNHSYDCLSSPEGNGPLQTLSHVAALRNALASQNKFAVFSGIFGRLDEEAGTMEFAKSGVRIPVTFLSAYAGGDAQHCRNILCLSATPRFSAALGQRGGLRVLTAHSWNQGSHAELSRTLLQWLKNGWADVAIGSGPHIAEKVSIVDTPRGKRVLATSLGNFIHPGLGGQPNNIVLQTTWRYDPKTATLTLLRAGSTVVSCSAERCSPGRSQTYPL